MVTPLRSLLITKDFVDRLSRIEERTKNLLHYWQAHAPHYTDHGKSHCEAVEMNLDELIPEDVKTAMNEYEIFLLLLGVSLHDIGIMCATSSDEGNREIRETHHERSKQFILRKLKDILVGSERYVVGEICLAHRDSVQLESLEKEKTIRHPSLGNMDVRMRFLAGLLRLADGCDMCHTRTSEDLISISKPPDESIFYHALHERVSGIRFREEEKTIYIDFNIASSREKNICNKYITDSIRKTLNSIRDCLVRNGVIYIDVDSKFSITDTLTSKLTEPKKMRKKKKPKLSELMKLYKKMHYFYVKKNYKKSVEYAEKLLEKEPSAALWNIKAGLLLQIGDMKEAQKCYDRCLILEPRSAEYLSDAGHFYGEHLLDTEKSFKFMEQAYQLRPKDSTQILNYAEALVTIGKAQEGYNIAAKYLEESNDIMKALNANFIMTYSLFLLSKAKEGWKQLKNLIMFLSSSPPSFGKTNIWVYNKIRKYINDSKLRNDVGEALTDTIDLLELKGSIEDFEKKHKKILKD